MRLSSLRWTGWTAISLAALLAAACTTHPAPRASAGTAPAPRSAEAASAAQAPDTVILDTTIVTLAAAPAAATAQALAITGGRITALGTTAQIKALAGPSTTVYTPPAGTTLLPGFIDPHSHMSAIGFYSDTAHWTDVASTNVLFKPSPGQPGCTGTPDP